MANEQLMTIRGRLTGDPELRFTPSGAAVANFTIAANARQFDKNSNEWKDKPTIFWRCAAWKETAENVADSLTKGMGVVALVELEARSYTTKEGDERTVTEARIEAIGPDLRWASAKVTRPQRRDNNGGGFGGAITAGGGGFGRDLPPYGGTGPAEDPWAANNGGGWGNTPASEEPPF